MSAFYDLASLVLVPSGYKAEKVYAQKPLTTDGQLSFSRASTATRVNSAGLIETVSSNVPRLDYLNSSCPKLQLEPQRSNLNVHSSDLSNAAWDKINLETTSYIDQVVAPDGTTTADKLIPNTTSDSYHGVQLGSGRPSLTGGTVYTFSVFAKAQGYDKIRIQNFSSGVRAQFNLTTGALINQNGTTSTFITPYGNGWYRIGFTYTQATTIASYWNTLVVSTDDNSGSAPVAWAGNGTDSIAVWGHQIEAGTYATSLIQTTTAAVTRLADLDTSVGEVGNFNLTPTGTKAVLFWEYQFNPGDVNSNVNIGGFRNGVLSQYGMYYWGTQGGKHLGFNSWSGDAYGISGANILFDGQIHKIAGVFDFNNFTNNVLFIDGVKQTISQVRGTTLQRTANKVSLNSPDAAGQGNKGMLRQFMYFNQNLTDAQLAELTAL